MTRDPQLQASSMDTPGCPLNVTGTAENVGPHAKHGGHSEVAFIHEIRDAYLVT